MKNRILLFIVLLLGFSCGSYNSINSFYNQHKNDDQVLAIRVPQVMLSLVSGISPEMEALVGGTKDIRYMQFQSKTRERSEFLNREMNNITGNSFIEVYRKNNELKRNVVSIRERGNTVREILIYNNNNVTGSFLYFNGNFDPVKVREMARNQRFEEISTGLVRQFGNQTPGMVNE